MPTIEKILADVIDSRHDQNIKFRDLQRLLEHLGFECSIRGDHYIYRREDTPIINIQPKGNMAKPYQVKQVRKMILEKKMEVH